MKTTWANDSLVSAISKVINESRAESDGTIKGNQSVNWAAGKHADKTKSLRTLSRMRGNGMVVLLNADEVQSKVNPADRVTPDDRNNMIGNRFDDAVAHFKSGQYMDIPEIAFNRSRPDCPVTFVDGRHRVAASMALGRKTFPALIDQVDYDKLSKVLSIRPYTDRESDSIPVADMSHHHDKRSINESEKMLHQWLDPAGYGEYRSDITLHDSRWNPIDNHDPHEELAREHMGNLGSKHYDAVHAYIMGGLLSGGDTGSREINQHLIKSHLSGKEPKKTFEFKEEGDDYPSAVFHLHDMDDAIRQNTHDKRFITYSGIGFDPAKLMNSDGIIHSPGYISSSASKGVAITYANADKHSGEYHVLKISHPIGSHGLYIGDQDPSPFGHKEHIMPRGESLKINKTPHRYMDNNGEIVNVWSATRIGKKEEK